MNWLLLTEESLPAERTADCVDPSAVGRKANERV